MRRPSRLMSAPLTADTILRGQPPDLVAISVAGALAVVTLAVGWLVFHRAEYQFAENA